MVKEIQAKLASMANALKWQESHQVGGYALKTLSKVKVILGKFQDPEVTCRSDCGKRYLVPEEKKTDVNMAAAHGKARQWKGGLLPRLLGGVRCWPIVVSNWPTTKIPNPYLGGSGGLVFSTAQTMERTNSTA